MRCVGHAQGSREYSMQQVVEQLGLGAKLPAQRKGGPGGHPGQLGPGPGSPGSRFVLPISECEFTVNAALEELQRNAFPTIPEHRPSRCTGTALQARPAPPPCCEACSSCFLPLLLGPCSSSTMFLLEKPYFRE
jgi:protein transport protein SEC23